MAGGATQGPGTDLRAPLTLYSGTKKTKVALTDASGNLIVSPSQTTIAAAAAAAAPVGFSGLNVAHAIYDFAVDGGAVSAITPASGVNLPANAIIIGATVNVVTAVTSNGSATVAIGTDAGSSATAILGATAKASLTLDALINGVPVLATPVKMTAAGNVIFTVGTAALTAGKIELFVYYVVAANA